MRKLRADITLKEAWAWASEMGPKHFSYGCQREIIGDMLAELVGDSVQGAHIPDSFYESPPIGSFGKFWDGPDDRCAMDWGYLEEHQGASWKRRGESGWYHHFTPCLPQDVDKDGYPE